ncbi:ATP-binding protein [Homoserinimonas aerilata]|nr:ATP-binding protein [Homoserinimonas aerilata]
MDPLARERDRLLQRSARMIGLGCTIVSLLCFLVPGLLEPEIYVAIIPLFVVLIAVFITLGNSRSLLLIAAGILVGLAILFVVQMPGDTGATPALLGAMAPLAAGTMASFAMVLMGSRLRVIMLVGAFILTMTLMITAAPGSELVARSAIVVVFGWALVTLFAYWLSSSVPRAARRINSIGRAHRAERRASETEAQRRQGARLLHDTVLATLTLLAHSGIGVAPESMRQQAADDARLLRQLRLGVTTPPTASGSYNLEPVAETPLGTTLESVKQRFGRMGLEVSWHGTGHVLLPSDVLDAFLLALSECLENVRRHAKVSDAHVTITEDETTIRAMVTDSGVGFDLGSLTEQNLGYKESIVGRLREVGGNARLFSSPGAGTTVVLEVPRA